MGVLILFIKRVYMTMHCIIFENSSLLTTCKTYFYLQHFISIEYNNQNKWGIYIECLCKWLLGILFFSSIWSSESGSWLLVERAKQILLGVERGQQSNIFYHIVKHFSFLYISFHISLHLSLFLQLEIIKMYLVSFIQSCKYFNKFWKIDKIFWIM